MSTTNTLRPLVLEAVTALDRQFAWSFPLVWRRENRCFLKPPQLAKLPAGATSLGFPNLKGVQQSKHGVVLAR
jgi:hypothetical protein